MTTIEDTIAIPSQDQEKLKEEIDRLYTKLSTLGWTKEACESIAPYTLRINTIKKEKNMKIFAHSYQTADIIFGIADIVGDSLGLAKKASEVEEEVILLCGVDFMAETMKILNPEKTVLVPQRGRDCTLADSITGEDVRKLKEQYPEAPVICYVNTNADVKAESDICCTSANVRKIVEQLDDRTIIFVPDENMGNNLAQITGKNIITFPGYCRTHHALTERKLDNLQGDTPMKTFAHLECKPAIIQTVDYAGGTGDMHKYAKKAKAGDKVLFLTEQGFIDRMKIEFPDIEFTDSNMICVSMKRNDLPTILHSLENPKPENTIQIDEKTRKKAFRAVNRMLKY